MPYLDINNCTYFYDEIGAGPETIVFGPGFLLTHRMWEQQIEALSDRYRCIVFDWRGQGWSEVTDDGYSVKSLCEDLLQLIKKLDIGPFHYVGFSMGGYVGFRLLLRDLENLLSAVLLDTQADAEKRSTRLRYEAMLFIARYIGYAPVIDRVMSLIFGPGFLNDPDNEEVERWKGIIMSNDRVGVYRAGCGIFRRPSVLPQLGAVETPTLLATGVDDIPTPVEKARRTHERLPNSTFLTLPASGHSTPIEHPEAVTQAIDRFITERAAVPAG